MTRRCILIVLDSLGVGGAADCSLYGDQGCNTLQNTAMAVNGLTLPHLGQLGLGNILEVNGVPPAVDPQGCYGKMSEKSAGKDTTTGHWEMMGIILPRPFPLYPDGFPPLVINAFEAAIGRKTLGNKAASGTVIIEELGREHMETGFPIVYTSADSVFQIAAHEEIIPLEELYEMCRKARMIMTDEHGVGRIIARPFIGKPGAFIRTPHRHDYSLEPSTNLLDYIIQNQQKVIGIGKIKDIFAGRGVSESYPTENNDDGIDKIISAMKNHHNGLIFANLIDFDQLYGHRNDATGYAEALERFDARLPQIMEQLEENDLLIITADHGCDPTTEGTDHTREYVPLLAYGPGLKKGIDLGQRDTFADAGATIAEHLKIDNYDLAGTSFYPEMRMK
ncbi:MAG TPA: phosphopentomutase [Syntrophomonadaceae bacterium]|jgi:phosphopentomutase|nr:phosphopentomutase [Syntrophomonadaceae bacterium]HRX20130.1 phosphopentomutase [Syntrophomonadaceae bacterium]